jgi:subtilase family serine protease
MLNPIIKNWKAILTPLVVSLIVGLGIAEFGNAMGKPATHINNAPVCPGVIHGYVRCHSRVIVDSKGSPNVTTTPSGYGPSTFHKAYNLPTTAQSNTPPIIAIVDAYDHPNIQSDLNNYSDTFSIPRLPACTGPVANSSVPCFQKISQSGNTSYPTANSGWALEISLDVEVAHAVCQNCSILLVEAYSNSYDNLMAAVDQASIQGATVISNSYGSGEFSSEMGYDSHFNYKGLPITFSSGDAGYGTSYPAASPYVIAVGGTTLNISGNSTSETAWKGSGSGCSIYESKPYWQQDAGCSNRTIADVSADADPYTGAAVYDSVRYQGKKGWFKVGGTSLSSPIIASVYALAGGVDSNTWGSSLPYTKRDYSTNLFDITSGSNGNCNPGYLCTAVQDYDGPTGLGTPDGLGAF